MPPKYPASIATPIPVLQREILLANIRDLQRRCSLNGVANRPHIKTHKSVEVAKLQIEAGAVGITCQTLHEAEVFQRAGIDDIFISFNLIGPSKEQRLADLHKGGTISTVADNLSVVEALSRAAQLAATPEKTLKILVECETGSKRGGVQTPKAAVELAQAIETAEGLSFGGLMLYPPAGSLDQTQAFLAEARKLFSQAGLAIDVISTGGTPNLARMSELGETEYRSGTSVYNDRMMIDADVCTEANCAMSVVATVVSAPVPERIILDAGSKALTSDTGGLENFGALQDYPDAKIYKINEEHGMVDVSACDPKPQVGELVRILPNHVCPVSNLFDRVMIQEKDGSYAWLTIDARGY